MTTVTFRKVKCDECGKHQEIEEEGYSLPLNWYDLSIVLGKRSHGTGVINAEFCSKECVIDYCNKIKKIPDQVYRV